MKTTLHTPPRSILPIASIITIVLLSGFLTTIAAQDWQFVQTPISAGGGYMNSMYFIDKNTGWIVGASDSGAIIHTTNGGIDWIVQPTPASSDLSGIFFVNADTGYAVGSEGTGGLDATAIILKTTNGGQQWLRQNSPVANASYSDVYFVNATTGWAIGSETGNNQALIVHTVDGATWEQSNQPLPQANFNAITFADSSHGWIVGARSWQPVILGTNDGGQTWIEQTQPLTAGSLSDLFFINADTGWVVGRNDTAAVVLKTTDAGTSWSVMAVPAGTSASSVCFISPGDGYLAVNTWQPAHQSSTLYKTTNGGATWRQVATTVPEPYADKVQVVRGSIHIFLLFSRILALMEEHGQLSKLVVTPADTFLSRGQQHQFTVAGKDSSGKPVPVTPVWSTTGGNIDSQTGLYTATQEGDFTVTASVANSSVTGTAQVHVTATNVDRFVTVPVEFALAQNFPNPFNPVTAIAYAVKEPCHVLLKVYDLTGREVATLVDGNYQSGRYQVSFDARQSPTGMYFYSLTAKDSFAAKKMAVIK